MIEQGFMNMKFDFDDMLIEPAPLTSINSRAEINIYDENGFLPIFTAPMDTVISSDNVDYFLENKINCILPRGNKKQISTNKFIWYAYGLKDFHEMFLNGDARLMLDFFAENTKIYALIDVANGHMPIVLEYIKKAKEKYGNQIVLMVGNIANPISYKILSEAGADFIRVGIGNGGGCLTTQQTGVGYPMGSLIKEIYDVSCKLDKPAKIVADGGFKKYADIVKALALGADYVMLGSILNKSLESCAETYLANIKHENGWTEPGELVNQYDSDIKYKFTNGLKLFKKFRGMSTKEVQKSLGNEVIKTSEGIVKLQPVEYTLWGWVDNFAHYLKSAMSYTDAKKLNEFIGLAKFLLISQNSFNRYNK